MYVNGIELISDSQLM